MLRDRRSRWRDPGVHDARNPHWRKISFGTDSPKGSRFVERMLTVVMTLRLQDRNVLDYVTGACEAALHGNEPPSLLPSAHAGQLAAAA